jgi:hypothetical protein
MEPATESAGSSIAETLRRLTPSVLPPSQPFQMQFGPERISGTFNIEWQEDADHMIEMINAVKGFLKKKEAAN